MEMGDNPSSIINLNDSHPENDTSNSVIDMRVNAFVDNSARSSVYQHASDFESDANERSQQNRPLTRDESPHQNEYNFAISDLRNQLHSIHFDLDDEN